jgi:hypothetical protein
MKMAQEQCIYCGPKCYRGAAHWARKEDGSLYAERNPPEQVVANDPTQGLPAAYSHLYKMCRLILRALLMERFKRNPTDSEMDTHWQMYAREVEAKR